MEVSSFFCLFIILNIKSIMFLKKTKLKLKSYKFYFNNFLVPHCVKTKHKYSSRKMQLHEIYVQFGRFNITTNSSETGSIKTNVSSIYIHPEWNIYAESFDADIAVLKLESVIKYSDLIIPICLPSQVDNKVEQVDDLMGVGCGRSEDDSSHG